MPNLHIIVGDANTRKSSLLRCLTGIGGGSSTRYMNVAPASGEAISVYCMLSALQENYKPMTPAEFVRHVKSLQPAPTDVAITLRVSASAAYPAVDAYLKEFARAGWPVVNVALLGPSACALRAKIPEASICEVEESPVQPTNLTASEVRNAWGWL